MNPSPSGDGLAADRLVQPFGLSYRAVSIATWHDNQEFFASIAANIIVRAHRAKQPAGHFPQHGVAGQMSIGIVDLLEMIEVCHDDP